MISSPCWASKSPRDPFQNAEASATSNAGVTGLIPGCRPKIPHCRVTCPPHLKKKKKKKQRTDNLQMPRLHLKSLGWGQGACICSASQKTLVYPQVYQPQTRSLFPFHLESAPPSPAGSPSSLFTEFFAINSKTLASKGKKKVLGLQ